mmetsp:Transcript_28544/g.73528  ORF Transcript_28544/g.73528 Transcript_28544/m.73528 type:complete len:265 (-) Transcript_28544:76-870(-)
MHCTGSIPWQPPLCLHSCPCRCHTLCTYYFLQKSPLCSTCCPSTPIPTSYRGQACVQILPSCQRPTALFTRRRALLHGYCHLAIQLTYKLAQGPFVWALTPPGWLLFSLNSENICGGPGIYVSWPHQQCFGTLHLWHFAGLPCARISSCRLCACPPCHLACVRALPSTSVLVRNRCSPDLPSAALPSVVAAASATHPAIALLVFWFPDPPADVPVISKGQFLHLFLHFSTSLPPLASPGAFLSYLYLLLPLMLQLQRRRRESLC